MARSWYAYDGEGDVYQPSNYNLMTVKPVCRTGAFICAIYATGVGVNPDYISDNLQTYISNGVATGFPQPQVPVGTKKYVYLCINL